MQGSNFGAFGLTWACLESRSVNDCMTYDIMWSVTDCLSLTDCAFWHCTCRSPLSISSAQACIDVKWPASRYCVIYRCKICTPANLQHLWHQSLSIKWHQWLLQQLLAVYISAAQNATDTNSDQHCLLFSCFSVWISWWHFQSEWFYRLRANNRALSQALQAASQTHSPSPLKGQHPIWA